MSGENNAIKTLNHNTYKNANVEGQLSSNQQGGVIIRNNDNDNNNANNNKSVLFQVGVGGRVVGVGWWGWGNGWWSELDFIKKMISCLHHEVAIAQRI